jgi:hypothetical protein
MPKLEFPPEAFEELRERPDYEDLMEEARKLVQKASGRSLSEEEGCAGAPLGPRWYPGR